MAEAALGAVANAGPSWLRSANFGVFSSLVYMWMFPDDKLEAARLGTRSRKAMLIETGPTVSKISSGQRAMHDALKPRTSNSSSSVQVSVLPLPPPFPLRRLLLRRRRRRRRREPLLLLQPRLLPPQPTEIHALQRFARTGWQSLPTSPCLCKLDVVCVVRFTAQA